MMDPFSLLISSRIWEGEGREKRKSNRKINGRERAMNNYVGMLVAMVMMAGFALMAAYLVGSAMIPMVKVLP